jgi:hypothetical protein
MDDTMRAWICGVGVGVSAMYLFDPDRGGRRRALLRDKAVRAQRKTRDAADAAARDITNRAAGLVAETSAMFKSDTPDDRVLAARVRSELGRVCSHPRALELSVRNGCVVLAGDVLTSELPAVIRAAESARGVTTVENRLTPYNRPDGVPSLQGESQRPGQWTAWLRGGWSPAAIAMAGAGAAAAVVATASARAAAARPQSADYPTSGM